ncbi:MAG: HAMP domain-containing histidine kinase [Chitinophagales bacterium]|nr:HAMP domain-containing histidine kinase [Chitinophagales bacterium]
MNISTTEELSNKLLALALLHMLKKLFAGPFTIFYIVFVYTIAFSVWWAYLLYSKNEAAFSEKLELDKIHYTTTAGNDADFTTTDTYKRNFEKYQRQRVMILAEGSVFVLLLIIGLMQVRRVFAKEIALAALQRNFVHSITHELKSPLASIKASLQTFQKRNLEPEKRDKLVVNSLSDVERLESLVDNILIAAKIEREEHGLEPDLVDISFVCEQISKRYFSNKKEIVLVTEIASNVYLKISKVGFASVVNNLVENAIKYSPENATVKLQLQQLNNIVKLTISDTGFGIPEAERSKIFQKFYRIGNEETRKNKGTGLGLYIVKRVVDVFKGKITIKNNTPSGTIFELEFMQTQA